MKTRPTDDRLREWLRAGDPAGDGGEPTAAEITVMRRRVLETRPAMQPAAWRLSPAWALAAAVLLALALGRGFTPGTTPPVGATGSVAVPTVPAAELPRQRQIQFDTPGGTRVVWVLDAEFEV